MPLEWSRFWVYQLEIVWKFNRPRLWTLTPELRAQHTTKSATAKLFSCFCPILSNFDNIWNLMATVINFWQLLSTFGHLFQLSASFDNPWQLLAHFGHSWQLFTHFSCQGIFGYFWKFFETFWRFLQIKAIFLNICCIFFTLFSCHMSVW